MAIKKTKIVIFTEFMPPKRKIFRQNFMLHFSLRLVIPKVKIISINIIIFRFCQKNTPLYLHYNTLYVQKNGQWHYFSSFFMYFPLFILASIGFSEFLGIIQVLPTRACPTILFCSQRTCTLLLDIFHFSATSFTEIYPCV
jgi:hypothetical protein